MRYRDSGIAYELRNRRLVSESKQEGIRPQLGKPCQTFKTSEKITDKSYTILSGQPIVIKK